MQNFMQIPPREASRQMGEIHAKFFIYICLFSSTHLQVRPLKGFFTLNTSNDVVQHKEVPFLG